jgi:hypothetical protein
LNAAEAELAADIVTAEFHAKDALRGAARCCNDLAAVERRRRQHALMMRARSDPGKIIRKPVGW